MQLDGLVRMTGYFPGTSSNGIFTKRDYRCLAFQALRMNRGISLCKLDAAFFTDYPELDDPDAKAVAPGVRPLPSTAD